MIKDLSLVLKNAEWICGKVQSNSRYAQNLYAALCNNDFISQSHFWCCSWYESAAIIAEMRQQGDRDDWCYSGINAGDFDSYDNASRGGFVQEGVVTPEVQQDLQRLGWQIIISG